MAACGAINLSDREISSILLTLSALIYADTSPHTIVNYLCAEVIMPTDDPPPQISATNWCLVTCVSSCVYKHTTFISPSSYYYINKPATYFCVASCFPSTLTEEISSSGGGGSSAAAGNLEKQMEEQIKAKEKELDYALKWLFQMLDQDFIDLAMTLIGFGIYIAILIEHMIEFSLGHLISLIAAAIEKIWCVIKNTIELFQALLKLALASIDIKDDAGNTHMERTTPDALASAKKQVKEVFSALIKCFGKAVQDTADWIMQIADLTKDVKQLLFAILSLWLNIGQIWLAIEAIINRIMWEIEAVLDSIRALKENFMQQIMAMLGIQDVIDEFNRLVQEVIDWISQYPYVSQTAFVDYVDSKSTIIMPSFEIGVGDAVIGGGGGAIL